MTKTIKRQLGDLGESIACKFLINQGFAITERNYLKPYGEIDIIAKKNEILYFFEVKSVSCETISHETDLYRPEENIHPRKLKRLIKTVEVCMVEKGINNIEFHISALIVRIDPVRKKAYVDLIENIV